MFECETCTARFHWRDDCDEHMDDYDHWPECDTCTKTFRTQRACNQHMDDTNHWAHYCASCKRRFDSDNNLKMHLNSRVHRGDTMKCPFCKKGYTTVTGLSHHLETGSCPDAPRLNRDSILQIIRERDPHGLITNKQLTWHDGTRGTYSATDQAWNGDGWECYLCHREFGTDRALNQHLNSPAHKQKVYHCPNRRCGKEFVALAGMFNHLESEACAFMRFDKVQTQARNVLQGNRLISFG